MAKATTSALYRGRADKPIEWKSIYQIFTEVCHGIPEDKAILLSKYPNLNATWSEKPDINYESEHLDEIKKVFYQGKVTSITFLRIDETGITYFNFDKTYNEARLNIKCAPGVADRLIKVFQEIFPMEDMAPKPMLGINEKSIMQYDIIKSFHPRLKEQCLDLFLAGKFDEAILNSGKVIEVYTRELTDLDDTNYGVTLMRKAFDKNNPILKYSEILSEQEGLSHLFAGFIGFFKNPHSHRFVGVDEFIIAFEILTIANHLCKMLDKIAKNTV